MDDKGKNGKLDDLVEVDLSPTDAELVAWGVFGYEPERPVIMTRQEYNALRVARGVVLTVISGFALAGLVAGYNSVKKDIEREGSFSKWYDKRMSSLDEIPMGWWQ